MAKNIKKSIVLIALALFLLLNFFYNQRSEAQEITPEETAVCHNTVVDYSQCYWASNCGEGEVLVETILETYCCPENAIDNEFEIPIGRTVDAAELLAEKITEKSQKLIDQLEYGSTIDIDQYCNVNNCSPQCIKYEEQQLCVEQDKNCEELGDQENIWQEYPANECEPECSDDTPKCCKLPKRCRPNEDNPCTGQACDPALENILDALINQTQNTKTIVKEIVKLEKDIEDVEKKLAKSRKRLFDCSLVTYEGEGLGEAYTGIMDCASVMSSEITIYSVLDQELQKGCYGHQYCEVMNKSEPCADDYFCCH